VWKKLLLGFLVMLLLAGSWVGWQIGSRYEPYPDLVAPVSELQLEHSALDAAQRRALADLIRDYRKQHHLPSLSLAIGLDGEVAYLGAVGFADLAREERARPGTLYRIGSVSKSITAVALGRLMEEGLVDIDRDFRDYVPDFPEKQWPFTLRQLTSHTAGVRHYVSPLENYRDEHYDTVHEALVTIADDRLIFEPGTAYRYSSYGFNMLSAAMTGASGEPFRELLQRLVFDPADMGGTFAEDPRQPNPLSSGFYLQTETRSFRAPYADNSYKVAGGGLLGRPWDLVRLGNALLTGTLLEPETWAELTTVVPLADGSTDHGYGIGFGIGEVQIGDRKIREVGHGGGSVGGLTAWKLFEDVEAGGGTHDLVVAVTMNISSLGNRASPHAVAYRAAELVLDALDAGEITSSPRPGTEAPQSAWTDLFDGETLDGWIPKVRGYPAGENPFDTFRVEDGKLVVSYDDYDRFDERFGHIFHATPYSHYRLQLEYRFVGEPMADTPGWAVRNSGAMLHSQDPMTMPPEQDFPISIEFQFLGGLEVGKPRTTGNLCTPGTHVTIDGVFTEEHCIGSSSGTFMGDQWIQAEALVLGDERFVHYIGNDPVLEYSDAVTGGGVVSGHDPAMKPEGEPLGEGYISLQSEGHRIEFRNIRLLNLKGCMNPEARNYAPWHVEPDPEACAF
jgi:CubicO group peptidase (beta-lactamase class C family)